MGIACKVYDQGAEAHPDLDDRDLQACLQARLAQQRRRLARQRRREQRCVCVCMWIWDCPLLYCMS